MGQLEYGIYDDYDNVPVSELEAYYGVYSNAIHRFPGQTGAGHPADEDLDLDSESDVDFNTNLDSHNDDNDWINVERTEEAVAEVNINTYAEPVSVPDHNHPFLSDDSDEMRAFVVMLATYEASSYIPSGYGMLPEEWEDGLYPTIQVIPTGRRGSKQLEIGLPDTIWRSRSELWVRALDVMIKIKNL